MVNPDGDIFWGRCSPDAISSVFKFDAPKWRDGGTCSHCGGGRPSVALELIKSGAEVEPTDKNYKIYIRDGASGSNPAGKFYLNHFSESQAVEFVRLIETGIMKLAFPGHFYSGLCFGIYKDAIQKMLAEIKKAKEQN